MSDLNVALRLSLINQTKAGAEAAKRDLKQLKAEAEKLGKTQAGFSPAALRAARQLEMAEAKKALTVERTTAAYRRQRTEMLAGDVTARRLERAREVRATRDAARTRREIRSAQTAMVAAGMAARGPIQWAPDGRLFRSHEATRRHRNEVLAATLAAQRAAARSQSIGHPSGMTPAGRPPGAVPVGVGSAVAGAAGGVAAGGRAAGLGYARAFIGGLGLGIGAAAVGQFVKESVFGAATDEFERDQLRVLGSISEKQMEMYRKTLDKTARLRGIGSAGSLGIFGGLMAGGLTPQESSSMTDSVAIFAKATRSSLEDASRATIALRNNMKLVRPEEIMAAYDAIAAGGKAGEFEVQDMARHLPSLLAKMQSLNESGVSGVRNTVALAQAVRKVVGSSDEAATIFENMLNTFTSSQFINGAKKIGIDVEKTMKNAKEKGLSPVFALLHKIHQKTGGDPFKISKLIPNTRAAAAVEAALREAGFMMELLDEMTASAGSTMDDYATATDNAKDAWDRFSSSIIERSKSIAETALPSITIAMDAMTSAMDGSSNRRGGLLDVLAMWNAVANPVPYLKSLNRGAGNLMGNEGVQDVLAPLIDGLARFVFGRTDAERIAQAYRDESRREGAPGKQPEGRMKPSHREAEDASMKEYYRLLHSGDLEAIMEEEKQKRIDGAGAAKAVMDSYKQALGTGLDDAKTTIAAAVAEFKAMLTFTAGPTISPTLVPAGAAGGAAIQHAGAGGSGVSVTQNISTSDPRMAARRAQREQNRAVNLAMANALHDTGLG